MSDTPSGSPPRRRKGSVAALQQRISELEMDLSDLQILYETTMEHGTSLENELMLQNRRMEELRDKMRKYLSPQLYETLLGSTSAPDTRSHSRVRLTIYFSDVVGFSDLTDSIEPELLSDVLNSYLTRMTEIALAHGGTVDKFIGDAIMVFFGAPAFIDDAEHARRCVRMALEMRAELFRLREGWRLKGITRPLRVRAGINTGFCTVGNFGSEHRMDYTIIGGQVNLASRLQSNAEPDSIYLASSTYSLVEDLVEARHIGPLQVKGIAAPVDSWELLGLRGAAAERSPYVAVEGGHLHLGDLQIDLAAISDQERAALHTSLARALAQLGGQG
ncbi:adenylate/guanylate cyclase domain-containing protein [Oscillochloris sp. ZM17-4]|uniref:adenylate/guanylate cyclase domain-containing protein n=1 Tax=Oscillochloris sp. ZM17-4 TaxID=2866714 RepID=UPI001C72A516|nr:adenylate/guanylate cyclase domain-containing protein [Oscillochloris sp. ZM17-4]MBX0328757.1 adenylate/guanylate cyclase domain-containing protein [Oscillochloris sp. ZM17-4]